MPETRPLRDTPAQSAAEADAPRGGGRRFVTATLSLVSLVAVGVAIAAGYIRGLQDREEQGPIPFLRAEVGEVKSRPENPGGIDPPHQDKLIYDRVAPGQSGKTVERIGPAPEEPLASAIAEAPPLSDKNPTGDAPVVEATSDTPGIDSVTPDTQDPERATTEPTENALGVDSAPEKENATAVPPPAEQPETGARPETGVVKPPDADAADVAATEPAAGGATETGEGTKPPPTTVAALPEDGYRVQLASFRTEKRARAAWRQFANAHGEALAALDHFIVPADLGDRGVFYRVQAGTFADKETAKEFCGLVRARGLSCIVVRK